MEGVDAPFPATSVVGALAPKPLPEKPELKVNV